MKVIIKKFRWNNAQGNRLCRGDVAEISEKEFDEAIHERIEEGKIKVKKTKKQK
jgi:hypothetical protein